MPNFVSGAQGDPQDTAVRIAPQDAIDIDDFPTLQDIRDYGTDFGFQQVNIDPMKILPGGEPVERIAGKSPLDPFTLRVGDVDPNDPGQLIALASVFDEYDVTTAAGLSRWRIGIGEGTLADPLLKFLAFNGSSPPMRMLNARLHGFNLSASPDSNFELSFPGLASRFDFFEDPVQTAGLGSTLPTVHGVLPDESHDASTTTPDSVFVQVVSISGSVITAKATIDTQGGSPAFAGSNTFSVVAGGDPVPMIDEATGLFLGGDPGSPLELAFPESPTLTALDEFEIETRMNSAGTGQPWSPTYSALRSLPSRNVRLTVNDLPFRFEGGFSLEARWQEFSLQNDTPGAQGGTVRRSGQLIVTLEVTREIRDLIFEQRRLSRANVPVVIEAISKQLVSGATPDAPFRFGVVLPSVSTEGPSYRNNAGATNTQETATLYAQVPESAYSYGGRSFSSHCTLFVDNGIASI